ncbi:MAG: O-antigen ligase family protein [Hyphomicrobiaceae bacterium]
MATAALHTLKISRGAVLSGLLAVAILSSSIVFSEPAPVDALLAGFIVAMCVLGGGRLGRVTLLNLVLWTAIVAFSFVATTLSPDFGEAFKHQAVTLFLVLSAAAIAAFIAQNPEPRARLVLNCYVAAIILACLLGYLGYFKVVPGAYELFTNYGRARGGFKDPNVFGAALCPAIIYLVWLILRRPSRQSMVPALLCLFMMPALLISFSRGAWVSLAVSLLVLGFIALTRTRRQSDHIRMAIYGLAGLLVLSLTFVAVLQIPQVSELMQQRASLMQGYDVGPEGRFGGQQKAIRLIMENPLGIGTHTFRSVHHHEEVHNVYLTMFHYGGWLSGLLFVAGLLITFAVGLGGSLRIGALQSGFAVATAALAGLIVEGLVIDFDHWRHVFIILALIWGLSDARPEKSNAPSHRRRFDPSSFTVRRREKRHALITS